MGTSCESTMSMSGEYASKSAHLKIALLVIVQGCCSVGLIMCNRYLAMSLKLPILTIGYQNLLATWMALGCWSMDIGPSMKPWKMEHLVRVIPLTCVFSLLLWTSFQALGKVSVATVVVFRNSSPFFTAVIERMLYGTTVSTHTMGVLLLMIIGALIYSSGDLDFNVVGYGWAFCNLSCTITAGLCGKSFAMGLKEEQTGFGLSCYQNLVSLPCLVIVAALTGEFWEWPGPSYLVDLEFTAKCVFVFSCLGCVTIGIATFELQKLVPQTTVTVANVTYKMITLFVNAIVFGSNVGLIGLFGLVVAQLAAVLYMYDRIQQENRKSVALAPRTSIPSHVAEDEVEKLLQVDIEAAQHDNKVS